MKVFVNLLIETVVYASPDEVEDAVIAACEEAALKVVWHKSKEADDR